jgi:hypothetical protein
VVVTRWWTEQSAPPGSGIDLLDGYYTLGPRRKTVSAPFGCYAHVCVDARLPGNGPDGRPRFGPETGAS